MDGLLVFGLSFVSALVATPLVASVARATGKVAAPSPSRWHARPTALFGGVAIWTGFAVALGIVALKEISGVWLVEPRVHYAPAVGIFASGMVMFAGGIADDLFALRPPTKLVIQALAGAVLISFGVVFTISPWVMVNILFTVFWFIGITNAINLLDNMDGVAAGVSALAAAGFGVIFIESGQPVIAALAFALAGGAAGFLVFNFSPARIFMGDSGSLLIGAVLAGCGAAWSMQAASSMHGLTPALLLLAIPIVDTALVTFARTTARQPISMGGRDHSAHRLVALGVSERNVALIFYVVAMLGAALAYGAAMGWGPMPTWSAVAYGGLLTLCAAYLARLHSYSEETARPVDRLYFLLEDLLYKRRLLEVLFDLVLFSAAYWGAFLLRFDGRLPPDAAEAVVLTVALAAACKSVAFVAAGVYRGLWQRVSIADVHRIIRAAVFGSLLTAAATLFLFPALPVPRSIFLLDTILVVLLAFGARLAFRSLDRARQRFVATGIPTLIYGAGAAGDLALREILANPDLGLLPVGFIDDDPRKAGLSVHGLPVHSGNGDLERVLAVTRVGRVVVGARSMSGEQRTALRALCDERGIRLLELRVELLDSNQAPDPAATRSLVRLEPAMSRADRSERVRAG